MGQDGQDKAGNVIDDVVEGAAEARKHVSAGVEQAVAMQETAAEQVAVAQQIAPHGESTKSVIAAIFANIAVGIVKFIAAAISGSSAMVSEGIHSIVDSGNGFLLLWGKHRAKRAPTIEHPFGNGKELYFWALVVAVSIFALGGGASISQGITAVREALAGTAEHGNLLVSYIVLIAAAIIEGFSLSVALREFNAARGAMGPFEFIHYSKDPTLFSVVLEDSAAELGLIFALIGLILTQITGNPIFDGIASIVIGALLMLVAVLMLGESKSLLIGEGFTRRELMEARAIVDADPDVVETGRILTMYFGPDSMLMTVDARFRQGMDSESAIKAVDRIEQALVARFPQTTRIFIEAEDLSVVHRLRVVQDEMPEEDKLIDFGGDDEEERRSNEENSTLL